MSTAIFFNVPAHGHVNPSLPLVAELARRDHQLTYVVTPGYQAAVEAAGAVFAPYATLDDTFFAARGLHGGVPQRVADALLATAAEILPELLALTRAVRPDFIMYDGMCPWGYYVARTLGVPAIASLSLLPLSTPPLREALNPEMLGVLARLLLRDIGAGLRAQRRARVLGKAYGVAPPRPAELLNIPADLAISYTSALFQPYAATVAQTVRFVGWTLHDAHGDALPVDVAARQPLIYISLGTLNNDNVAFWRACIAAFAGGEQQVIISTGGRFGGDVFGTLPANITIRPWVPQATVLQHASLFITHGGMGSVHDGLFCGVPLLLVPQQAEQHLIARRVAELGAGLLLKPEHVSAERLGACAGQLLADDRYRSAARKVGDSLREAGGARRGADEIEALLRRQAAGQVDGPGVSEPRR